MHAARAESAEDTVPGLSAGPVALAWLTQFLVGTDLFVVAPLLPRIAASFGVSTAASGLLVTAFSIAYVVASPFAGWLSDRRDRATVLVVALVLFSAANAGTALAPGFGLLLVARVVAGVAAAGTGPTVYALVSTRARPGARAQVLAVVGSGLLTALWVGAPAGSLLGRYVGWRSAFVILAAGTFLLALPHAFVWRARPVPAAAAAPDAPRGAGRPGTGAAVSAVAVTALWAFSVYSLYTFLAVALHADGRATAVTWLLVVYGIGAVVGGQVGGRFADRSDAVRVTRSALALTAVLEAVVALVFPVTWALACALGLFALAAYAFFPAQQRHLVDLFPERATAMLSWNNSALFVGLSLAGAVGGQIVHALDYPALLYAGAAVAVPACLVARGRPRRSRERP
ncbi:MFS transporter [Streptomyces sp. 5-8]|uniref:MFS transporter n=1 Tax=Streptomyces musisoli TaxID=2802280 RepID=A0ABS1P3E1_9ACTN|nr:MULTISPECIES: MFS transporter [Streptomyces]MBL1106879.1 MFS transporter [Streptomyces musisoli]MBY8844866.1 MFS transporter [Streptomyces sp. SP2-10]